MAVVQLDFEETSSSLDEYLRYCQIISDAFARSLDQNECNIKVVIGIAQELTNQQNEVEDLWEFMKPDVYIPPTGTSQDVYKEEDGTDTVVNNDSSTISPSAVAAIKNKIKEACYDCDYGWPGINFNENFNWSFEKLKLSLDTYISTFKQITNPNFCHAAGAFNFACLQDLLKLIALLLSAYSAVLALRKIGSISLSAFIKGVISGLLGQLLGSISLQLDLSKTGLSCLIKVFEEIASNIPDGSNLSANLPDGFLEDLGIKLDDSTNTNATPTMIKEPIYEDYTDETGKISTRFVGYREVQQASSVTSTGLDAYNDDGTLKDATTVTAKADGTNSNTTAAYNWYQDTLKNLGNPTGENFLKQFTKQLKKDSDDYQEQVSNSFKYVNDTISQATDDFNNTISQLFGLLDYFQCEFARSGTDFLELLEYMQKLINVINLLSAVISLVAKKQVEKLCQTKGSVADLSDIISEDIILSGSNDLDPVDVIEEFLGKVVEETVDENDEIVPIIYDKDKETMLPKLNLLSCNLKEFIDAHNIDNIIEKAIEEVRKDAEKDRVVQYDTYESKFDPSLYPHVSLPSSNIVDRDKWKVYPIQYVRPPYSKSNWSELPLEDQQKELEKNSNTDYGLQSILDFVYNNPLDRTSDVSKTEKATTNDSSSKDDKTSPVNDKSYRDSIKTPFYSPAGKDKKSFENECRSINDVLSIIENLQGK